MAQDPFLEALAALEDTLADNQKRTTLIKKRIAQLRRLRSKGASYTESVSRNDGPLIVQLLTESSAALDRSGSNVRRAEARALTPKASRWSRLRSASASHGNASRPSCAKPQNDAH